MEMIELFYYLIPALIAISVFDFFVHFLTTIPIFSPIIAMLVTTSQLVDIGFLVILSVIMMITVYITYENPNKFVGLIEFIFLIILGFMWVSYVAPTIVSLGTTFNLNTNSSLTYSIFSSIYGLYYFAVFLIMDIITNFRNNKEIVEDRYPQNYRDAL
jgi:hypothetical protein